MCTLGPCYPPPVESSDRSAQAWDRRLQDQAERFDLRNHGRYRSTWLLDELFHDLVAIVEPSLFIEAGAFDAATSRRVKQHHPGAQVVAFEASPATYERFRVANEAAGVDYRNLALTDTPGPVRFHVNQGSDGAMGASSLMVRDTDVDAWTPGPAGDVEVRGCPLDLAVDQTFKGRVCLWIDVEGAAQHVLGGADRTLGVTDIVKIEVETLPFWKGQWTALDVLTSFLDRSFVPLARDAQGAHQFNLVLASARVAEDPRVQARLDTFLRQASRRELPGPLGRLRRNTALRRLAAGARAAARRPFA